MVAVKARRREIIVQIVRLEPWEAIKVILGPLPHIAENVMETECIGRVEVDWLQVYTKRGKGTGCMHMQSTQDRGGGVEQVG